MFKLTALRDISMNALPITVPEIESTKRAINTKTGRKCVW